MNEQTKYSYAARVMTAKSINSALAIMDLYVSQQKKTATIEDKWVDDYTGFPHYQLSCGHACFTWHNYCPICGAMIVLEDEEDGEDL